MVINITLSKANILCYNISEYTVSSINQIDANDIKIAFNKTNYLGLQKIESDDESKLTYIDETVDYIPLNCDIIKKINHLYLNKNEMYVEFESHNLKYKKITDKKIMCIMINPYKQVKHLVEFQNKEGIFPYDFNEVVINNHDSYLIKLIIKHGNSDLYNENILVNMTSTYTIPVNLHITKKPDNIKVTIINLTDDTNIGIDNLVVNQI